MSSMLESYTQDQLAEFDRKCRAAFQTYLDQAGPNDKHQLDPFALFCSGFELGLKLGRQSKNPPRKKS